MARCGCLLALGLFAVASIHGPARAESARQDLQDMAEAMRSLAYEGVFVYSQGERAETMRVVHGVIDGVSHERVSALSGKSLEIIRNGDQVLCVLPDTGRAIVGQRVRGLLPGALAEGLDGLAAQYRLHDEGPARMTDRDARIVRIESTDGYRYGYRLWLDRETDLLLRSDLLAADGSVLERLMFAEIELLDQVDAQRFSYDIDNLSRIEHFAEPDTSVDAERRPALLPDSPPGFELVVLNRADDRGHSRHHAVFSDGFASVSVFIEADDTAGTLLDGLDRRGAVHMKSHRVDGSRVTIVGAVPEATLDRMMDSLLPAGAVAGDR